MVDLCLFLEETRRRAWSRSAASRSTLIVARRLRALRHRGAEARRSSAASSRAPSSRSRCPSPRRAPTSARCAARPTRQHGGYLGQRPEDVDLRGAPRRPHPARLPHRRQRRDKHEGLTMLERARATPTASRSARSRRWAGDVVNDVFFTDCHVPAENRLVGEEGRRWRQLMAGLNVRAADPRRAVMLGIARARVRRRARLRQGAQAVRPPDRHLPGARATGSPTSPPRSSAAGCSPTTSRARSTPTRARCSRARPRWPSSRSPRRPRRSRSRACR